MTKNINSASRILSIIDSVKAESDATPAHDVWGKVFEIENEDKSRKTFAISRCLADLHDEVESVRSEMKKLGYSENLYNTTLNKCNTLFAVQTLMSKWQSMKQQITPEVPVALGFCSEILPNEEDLIDKDSLDDLKRMAADLRGTLSSSKLPDYTRNIIDKHITKIEEALTKYRAVGAKAFEEVLQSAYGEVIANEEAFKKAKGSPELGKLSAMWQKTKSALDGVVDANKRLGAMGGMAEKGQKVLEFLSNLNV
ncbi:hypothetical protein BFR57_09535 [Idiomarina sp. MD25a]|uniref:hypothetical protein n=1 Tax=Idiomarina sp. MD25a TaxID=1889913 RepID=UPI0008F95CA8|nr:hypothetical protein [Idiomarina sp. MD25a]OIM97958.1 hypothetical protein BFR57_09535 [Idiomarina sp. MD25a]